MSRIKRPSPALVISILALVAALAGTALAGSDATTSAINRKTVKKIATRQIKKLAPGLSVANAKTANTAGSANPAAFAHVLTDGTVDAANSKGVTQANVTHSGGPNDEYCFHGLGFRPRGGQATIDYSDTMATGLHALFDIGGVDPTCPVATTQAHVNTVPDSTSFYVVFYR